MQQQWSNSDSMIVSIVIAVFLYLLVGFFLAKWFVKRVNRECWEEEGHYADSRALSFIFGVTIWGWPFLPILIIEEWWEKKKRLRMIE